MVGHWYDTEVQVQSPGLVYSSISFGCVACTTGSYCRSLLHIVCAQVLCLLPFFGSRTLLAQLGWGSQDQCWLPSFLHTASPKASVTNIQGPTKLRTLTFISLSRGLCWYWTFFGLRPGSSGAQTPFLNMAAPTNHGESLQFPYSLSDPVINLDATAEKHAFVLLASAQVSYVSMLPSAFL